MLVFPSSPFIIILILTFHHRSRTDSQPSPTIAAHSPTKLSHKMVAETHTSPSAPTAGEGSSNVRDLKPVIKNVDMADDMQAETIEIAYDALEKFTVEKDMAGHVKRTMDQKFGPTWHAVVGQKYGSYVTHETKHFIYFCKLKRPQKGSRRERYADDFVREWEQI